VAQRNETGTFDIGLSLDADRDPPRCEVLGPEVRATIDGIPLATMERGSPAEAERLPNGITIPAFGCRGPWFTISGLDARPDGEVTVVRVDDGRRSFEMRALNLRALVRAELSVSAAAPGDTVTMRIHPDGDPPLVQKGANLSISRDRQQVASIQDGDLRVRDRSVSFVVPALAPGTYGLSLGVGERPQTVSRCAGASTCALDRYRVPQTVPIVIR